MIKNLPAGMEVQSIALSKYLFSAESASTWIKSNGFDPSDSERTETDWIFHQSPAGPEMKTVETEHKGVTVTICKKTRKAMGDNTDLNDLATGERGQLEADHDELPKMAAGASFLTKMAGIADEGIADLERHKPLIEHPEVKQFAEDSHQELLAGRDHMKKCMKEWYPESDEELPENGSEPGPDEDNEPGYEKKSFYARVRKAVRKELDDMDKEREQEFTPGSATQGIRMPLGAKAIIRAMDRVHYAHKAVQDELPVQEHPDIRAMAEGLDQDLPERKSVLHGMLKKHYPATHKALGWEDEDDFEKKGVDEDDFDGDDDDVEDEIQDENEGETAETEEPEEEEEKGIDKCETTGKPGPCATGGGKVSARGNKIPTAGNPTPRKLPGQKPGSLRTSRKPGGFKGVLTSKKQLKSGDHFVEVCSCGKVMGQCRCMAANKLTVLTKNGCSECRKKVTKLGANVVEPGPEPQNGAMTAEPMQIIDAIIGFLTELRDSVGGSALDMDLTPSTNENPYNAPNRPGTGKSKKTDEEDEEPLVTKGDDEDEDDEKPEFNDAEAKALKKALDDILESQAKSARKLSMLTGGSGNGKA